MTPVLTHDTPTRLISSFSNGSKGLISSTPRDPGILIPYAERAGSQLFPLRVGEKLWPYPQSNTKNWLLTEVRTPGSIERSRHVPTAVFEHPEAEEV